MNLNINNNNNKKKDRNDNNENNQDRNTTDLNCSYVMPDEYEEHEGTWLQWPHHHQYGKKYRKRLDGIWITMTKALYRYETVHIIAYNLKEQRRITQLLLKKGHLPPKAIYGEDYEEDDEDDDEDYDDSEDDDDDCNDYNDCNNNKNNEKDDDYDNTNNIYNNNNNRRRIDFHLFPTNDVWIRDNGPIFVRKLSRNDDTNTTSTTTTNKKNTNNTNSNEINENELVITDWGFNGWGGKVKYNKCNQIPALVGNAIHLPIINLNTSLILEGGSFEIDSTGQTLLATKSSIINPNRNPNMTQEQVEQVLTRYLGVSHFIWLNGRIGRDITDLHIDSFARFAPQSTIVTMNRTDLLYYELSSQDIDTLYNATNAHGMLYNFVILPLTKRTTIRTTYGKHIKEKGSYVNHYVANHVVLIPQYNDENDSVAASILQTVYNNRTIVGIDCCNLIANGGMIHCVTQQQPVSSSYSVVP